MSSIYELVDDLTSKAKRLGFEQAKLQMQNIINSHEWDSDGFSEEGMNMLDYIRRMEIKTNENRCISWLNANSNCNQS